MGRLDMKGEKKGARRAGVEMSKSERRGRKLSEENGVESPKRERETNCRSHCPKLLGSL